MKEALIQYIETIKSNAADMQKTYDNLPDGDELKIELGGRIDTIKYVVSDLSGIIESYS